MAIDPNKEELLTLTAATKVIPARSGRRVARTTLWRWCRKGLRGVFLEYVRIGRDIATSQEALGRFFVALADADEPLQQAPALTLPADLKARPRSDRARQDAVRRAERRLVEAGL